MMSRVFLLILIVTILTTPLFLFACSDANSDNSYDEGYNLGYKAGYNIGKYEGFRDGCKEGYTNGYKEAKFGLPSSMDWFYSKYPQYR